MKSLHFRLVLLSAVLELPILDGDVKLEIHLQRRLHLH